MVASYWWCEYCVVLMWLLVIGGVIIVLCLLWLLVIGVVIIVLFIVVASYWCCNDRVV